MTSTTSVDTTALNKDQKDVYDRGKVLFDSLSKPDSFGDLAKISTQSIETKITKPDIKALTFEEKAEFDCGLLKFLINQSLKQDTDLKNALTCTTTTLKIYEGKVTTSGPGTSGTKGASGPGTSGTSGHTGGSVRNKTSKKPFIGGNNTLIPIYVKVKDSYTQVGQLVNTTSGELCFVFSSTDNPCFEFIVKGEYAIANYPTDIKGTTKRVCLKLDKKSPYTADKNAFFTFINGSIQIYGSLNDTMDVNITTSVKCEKNGDKTVCTQADTSTLFTLFGYNVSKTSAALATAAALGSVYLYRKMKKKSKRKTDSSSSGKKSSHSNRKSSKRGK